MFSKSKRPDSLVLALAFSPNDFISSNDFNPNEPDDKTAIDPDKKGEEQKFYHFNHLRECHCHPMFWRSGKDNDLRKKIEEEFRASLVTNPVLLDIGSGSLFQTLVYTSNMLSHNNHATLITVDALYNNENLNNNVALDAWYGFLEFLLKNDIVVNLHTSCEAIKNLYSELILSCNEQHATSRKQKLDIYVYDDVKKIENDVKSKITHVTAVDLEMNPEQLSTLLTSLHLPQCHIFTANQKDIALNINLLKENLLHSFYREDIFNQAYAAINNLSQYEFIHNQWKKFVEENINNEKKELDVETLKDRKTLVSVLENMIDEFCNTLVDFNLEQQKNMASIFKDIIYRFHSVDVVMEHISPTIQLRSTSITATRRQD